MANLKLLKDGQYVERDPVDNFPERVKDLEREIGHWKDGLISDDELKPWMYLAIGE